MFETTQAFLLILQPQVNLQTYTDAFVIRLSETHAYCKSLLASVICQQPLQQVWTHIRPFNMQDMTI